MVTVFIDLADLKDKKQLHDKIRKSIAPIPYEGNNMDALHDVLTEYAGLPVLRFYNAGVPEGEMSEYIVRLRRVCRDAMMENPQLKVIFEED